MARRTHRGKHEGTVSRRATAVKGGNWVIAYPDETGKRVFEYGFKTEREAKAALRHRQERKKERLPVRPATERETLAEMLGRWLHISLELKAATNGGRHYTETLNLLQRCVASRPVSERRALDVTASEIDTLLRDIHEVHGASTAQHVRTALRTAYNFVIRKDRTLHFNPVQASETIEHRPRPVEVLSRDAYHAILAAMRCLGDPVLESLVIFTLDTCCRPSEALAVTCDRIDWEERTVLIDRSLVKDSQLLKDTKTHQQQVMPLDDTTIAALNKLPRAIGDVPVFQRGDGRFLNETSSSKAIKKACGLPLQKMRSGGVTVRLQAGDDIYQAQQQLRHRDIGTTAKHYAGISAGMRRESTERRAAFLNA